MRAVICRAWGGPEALTVEDVPTPAPGKGEVLIGLKAASVNYADLVMIQGQYQTRPEFPFSPGLEGVGTVLACGEGVTQVKKGERVMAFLNHGGFAEQVTAAEADTFAVPDGMDDEVAGSFLIAYASSHVALRWQAQLRAGERLLVLGAAGGVGLTAVEIGKAMGATVIAGASNLKKLATARARGADHLIEYTRESVKARVAEITGGEGVEVCFDPVGGDLFDQALSSLGWGGRILIIGFVGGIPQIPANRLLVKHRSAMGSSLRYFRQRHPEQLRDSIDELVAWWRAGELKPHVTERFPLERAPAAMTELLERRATGRVVIEID